MCILYKIANIELVTWIALLIFYLHGHKFLLFSNRCSLFQTEFLYTCYFLFNRHTLLCDIRSIHSTNKAFCFCNILLK